MSGPMGAGKTAVAKELLALLPAPLSYIEGDTFWSFINKDGERGSRDNFPVLVRSMTPQRFRSRVPASASSCGPASESALNAQPREKKARAITRC
jgi:ATP-dependent protease HslVU (ClpYQ) ATPase subunit